MDAPNSGRTRTASEASPGFVVLLLLLPGRVALPLQLKLVLTLLLALVLAGAGSNLVAQARTFTDQSGRTMVAEVVEATEESVRVRRDDGRFFEIELATLSPEDRTFVAEWRTQQAFAFGGVEVTARRVRLDSERKQTRSSTRKDETWCYKLTVSNHSRLDLTGLRVEYRLFYIDDSAKADRDELPLKRSSGRTTLAGLAAGTSAEVQTTAVELQTTTLKPGRRYSGTGRSRVQDALAGIWVRVYRDSELLHEFADPTTLTRDEAW